MRASLFNIVLTLYTHTHTHTHQTAEHATEHTEKQVTEHSTPAAVPPVTSTAGRVSSSYSLRWGFEPAFSGQQPAARPLRHAAKSQGWEPLTLSEPMLSYYHEFSRDKQVT